MGDNLQYAIWGSVLSPFSLKVRAMCDFARVPYVWAPGDVNVRTGLGLYRRVRRLQSGALPLTFPPRDALDEYPLVPFLFANDDIQLYDSSAIADWLDTHPQPQLTTPRRLVPEDPLCAFVTHLIDDHFDEFGLYVAHHHRWVTSASDNDAGARVADEMAKPLPPVLRPLFAKWFARRQVRRLPYLFSVAPKNFTIEGVSDALTPPSRAGFPETHRLLNEAFDRSLDLVEAILCERPFLFGTRFTLADASVYGELGMNTSDPAAERIISARAPTTRHWLEDLHNQAAQSIETGAEPDPCDIAPLGPLLEEIASIHVPLMHQNEAAYDNAVAAGCTRFNEAAFDRHEALYDGNLLGHPFRSVVKTFQLKPWRALKDRFSQLSHEHRALLPESVVQAFEGAS